MNFIQSIIYGFLSGVTEFTPVSSYGHQVLLRKLFGVSANPMLNLMIRLGLLVAVYMSCRTALSGYSRILSAPKHRRRTRTVAANMNYTYDLRFLLPASVAMLAVLLFQSFCKKLEGNELLLCVFFAINGIVLYAVDHMPMGNKDSGRMSGLDAIYTGLMGGFSIFPGISRLGMCLCATVSRGADKSNAYNLVLVLSIPALLLLALSDLIGVFTVAGISFGFVSLLAYLVAGISAFAGGYLVVMFMRFMMVNTGFSGYACYCWGVAILSFVLYLIA